MFGSWTYSDFRDSLEGIATNILAARLRLLTNLDLIERVGLDHAVAPRPSALPSAAPL